MENRRSPNAPKITTNAPIVQLSCTIKSVDVSVAVLGGAGKKGCEAATHRASLAGYMGD